MPITLLETWQARYPSVSMKRKVTDIAGGRNAGSPIAVDLSMIYGAENWSSLKGIDSLDSLHFYCNSNSARPHSWEKVWTHARARNVEQSQWLLPRDRQVSEEHILCQDRVYTFCRCMWSRASQLIHLILSFADSEMGARVRGYPGWIKCSVVKGLHDLWRKKEQSRQPWNWLTSFLS